jgi:ubiquinone/menaquinone biosynthesis C-methylase UbiE
MTMTRMDSIRIGKNFGYMAHTLTRRPEEAFVDAVKACLEHHFDNHVYCGEWCKRKHETDEEKITLIKYYYRCKDKDAKLYALLANKIERFITKERLDEMAHDLDTNMNEAFNQICTWFAPKNKLFAGSGSLANQIALAVGIHSLGVEMYFR